MFSWDTLTEIFSLLGSITLLYGYWLWINRHPQTQQISLPAQNRQIRRLWICSLEKRPGSDLLAVQTLRNAIMVTTALASATILTLLGALTLLAQRNQLTETLHHILLLTDLLSTPSHIEIKLILLAFLQILAFFCFLTAIRYYGHISFLVCIPETTRLEMLIPQTIPPDRQTTDPILSYLQRAGSTYAIGIRLFMASVPIFIWLLGNLALLIGTLLLISLMYLTDRIEL